jgi:hypothetical protein
MMIVNVGVRGGQAIRLIKWNTALPPIAHYTSVIVKRKKNLKKNTVNPVKRNRRMN